MNEAKWEEIKNLAKKKFKVLNEEKVKEGEKEIDRIEFEGPLGRMKLEWVTKPKVLGVKTSHAAKRAGATAQKVEQVLSETEKVNYLKAYVLKDENWVEMEAGEMFGAD
jgi:hypothetical protein